MRGDGQDDRQEGEREREPVGTGRPKRIDKVSHVQNQLGRCSIEHVFLPIGSKMAELIFFLCGKTNKNPGVSRPNHQSFRAAGYNS